MSIRRFFPILASGTVILMMLACVLPFLSGGSTPGPSSTPAPTSAPASAATGPCSNPWEPVVVGANWNYNVTGNTNGSYTLSILSLNGNGFTEQDAFSSGITRNFDFKCDQGAITAVDPLSADVSTSSSALNMQTISTDGHGLPAKINAGDTWSILYHMAGTMTEHGTTSPVKEDLSENCTADGMESVTVAAGTFNAMHLTCKLGLTIMMTIQGSTSPIVSNSQAERWYARNVGLVKSTDQSNAGLRTVELTAYKIP